jgi:hypothetical protein
MPAGTQLYLTPLHAMAQQIRSLVSNIRKALEHDKGPRGSMVNAAAAKCLNVCFGLLIP